MFNAIDLQTGAPRDPVTHPDVPDTPHPASPESLPDPPDRDVYPVTDPLPGSDPDTEPIRDPEPIPSYPATVPGGPPNVVI